ncbi:MAG: haloacid dehalogenase type II [Gammaproteobacteria bacterium]|nr:haloacid dehalogenase type II [Gammaproteobacteria bacterium]
MTIEPAHEEASRTLASVVALTFDVFGTVVDWRSSIVREGWRLSERHGFGVDWTQLADEWRAGYAPAIERVRSGELPWMTIDALHRMLLDELLLKFGIDGLSESEIEHLNRAWHRLDPWPDAVIGLNRLRSRYILATLSNGNMSLLVNMAKYAGLPWDCVLSAELCRRYKTDAQVYEMAARLLGLAPEQVMMVAAHVDDLEGARNAGFRTAFVSRPLEHGPRGHVETVAQGSVDIITTDLLDLAEKLGG